MTVGESGLGSGGTPQERDVPQVTLTVTHEAGLHARPASLFVEMCSRFRSDITVASAGRSVNGKSILGVLTLGVHKGGAITVSAEGDDAEAALEHLQRLVESNFEVTT
jgi:phosphocarrier protein